MGAQIRTDNLPYKILIPVFRFYMPGTCSSKRTDPHALQAGYCDDIPRQETGIIASPSSTRIYENIA